MKKLALLFLMVVCAQLTFAQTILDVAEGNGTLNDAIAKNQGTVVYRLKAGGWYGLTGIIQNSDYPLKIIGEKPAAGQMPAMVQAGTKTDGSMLDNMFDLYNNITLKNIFFVNANSMDNVPSQVFIGKTSKSIRIIIDSVTFDPVGQSCLMSLNSVPKPNVYITNSLFLRMGQLNGANDGHFINISGDATNGVDTLYMENNTFASTGTNIYFNTNLKTGLDNVIWINHNTFLFHKSQLAWTYKPNEYYVTNNLFYDFCTQPWVKAWNVSFVDGTPATYCALVNDDTLTNEVLPSTRKLFINYNTFYTDQRIKDIPAKWAVANTKNNDGKTPLASAYLMDLAYPKDSAKVNREAGMFYSTNFPGFKFNPALHIKDVDPIWNQKNIYKYEDTLVVWTLPAAQLNTWGYNPNNVDPQPNATGSWFISADGNYGDPQTWPRMDGSYTNSTLRTGSIEKLPLGDLNWFPTQKATWESKKATIQQHIVAELEDQVTVGVNDDKAVQIPSAYSLDQNYPNPFNPSTKIVYSIEKAGQVSLKIFNLLGQEISTLINNVESAGVHSVSFDASRLTSGVYLYKIQSGSFSATRKMVLMK